MKKSILLLFVISLLFTACGPSTKLVRSWSDKEITPKTYQKLAVVALTPNASSRYLIERAIVDELKKENIKAITTYEIFPLAGKMDQLKDMVKDKDALKQKIKQKVEDNHIDALMIISVFNIEKEQRFVPDNNYAYGSPGYYASPYMHGGLGFYGSPYWGGAYYNYYAYTVGTVYDDGYYVDDYTYFLECNLFDVASEKLLWTGRTKTVNMESVEEEVIYFSKVVIKDIMKKKVLVP